MPAVDFTESVVEAAALEWFAEIGYGIGHGPDLEPGGIIEVRATLREAILRPRLLDALRRINPGVPEAALEAAVRRVERMQVVADAQDFLLRKNGWKGTVIDRFLVMVRRVLNRHKYPPENRDEAVKLIIEQAELLAEDMAA